MNCRPSKIQGLKCKNPGKRALWKNKFFNEWMDGVFFKKKKTVKREVITVLFVNVNCDS